MSKRFTDTDIWNEDWFVGLSQAVRFFWFYLKDKCDHAGIWRPNLLKFEKVFGYKIDIRSAVENINSDKERIIILPNGRLFLTGFIPFQYGRALNLSSRTHMSVYQSLIDNEVQLSSIRPLIEVRDRAKDIPVSNTSSKETTHITIKESDVPAKNNLTDLQKVMTVYKIVTGYDRNDKEWDRVFFSRYARAAADLVKFMGNWKDAADCIEDTVEKIKAWKPTATISIDTILSNHAAEWKKDKCEKEAKRGVLSVPSAGSLSVV